MMAIKESIDLLDGIPFVDLRSRGCLGLKFKIKNKCLLTNWCFKLLNEHGVSQELMHKKNLHFCIWKDSSPLWKLSPLPQQRPFCIWLWYVSNVSINFDAPCLFIHHLLCVLLHFVVFYAFSGTNLLTRRHSASFLFSAVFVFQKSYTGNILGIRRNKGRTSYFSQSIAKSKDETEEGQGPATP
jgi:hypothetical protein